jgi:hypothetical protein
MRREIVAGPEGIAPSVLRMKRLAGFGCVLSAVFRGVLVGSAGAALLAAVDHLINFGPGLAFTVVIAAGAIAGGVIGFHRRPGTSQSARALDRHFDLYDRTVTALQLQDSDAPLANMQRRDATDRLRGLDVRKGARESFHLREAVGASVALAVFLALALTVPAAAKVTKGSITADLNRIHAVLHHQLPKIINSTSRQIKAGQAHNATVRQLYRQLQWLRRQLRAAHNRADALRAISMVQQSLHHLAAGLHPIKPAAAAQLLHALHSILKSGRQSSSRSGSSLRAAKALSRLASSLSRMSPAQRAALARSLAKAANSVSSHSLQSSLRQAASSLGYNDSVSAAAALRQAASALSRSPSQQSGLSRLSGTSSQLQALKGAVTGLGQQTPGSNSGSGGKPGSGQPGNGKGHGAGHGRARGHGNGSGHGGGAGHGNGVGHGNGAGHGHGRGQGTGLGRGNGAGSGNGSGQGQVGSGGHGIGGGKGGRGGSGAGHSGSHVYVPGKAGKGPHSILVGPTGAPLPGASVPYQEVILRYEQSARAALDHGALPASLQTFVRRYFSSISR